MHRYFLAFLTILLSACGGGETPVERGNRTQSLYMNIGTEPQNLDPHTVTGFVESQVINSLLEGLTSRNQETLEVVPGVAERWEISEDGLVYDFYLRSDAVWSNGDPVTSHDFAYSWQRILSPELASEYAYMLYPIRGAREFHLGMAKDFSSVAVRVVNERQLRFELTTPTPYFLTVLGHFSSFPVHPPTIEKFGGMTARDTPWPLPENFVGNGAFLLESWEINRKIVVKKNLNYHDQARIFLNEIHFLPIDSASTEERMFRAGQLHITASLPPEKIPVYKKKWPAELRIAPQLSVYYYEFNTKKPPLNDVRVRRALGMAIERKKITDLLKGGQAPAHALTPPGTGGYQPEKGIDFNPERARELLAEAGYGPDNPLPELEILYNTSEGHRKIAEAIQQMWKKILGIDVRLQNQEWKVYLQSRTSGEYQIARAGWIGDYPDPNTFLDLMMGDSGNNRSLWSNPNYDALIRTANRQSDQNRRYALFKTAEALLMREMPVAPIYIHTRVNLVHPAVMDWKNNLLDYHNYKDVHLRAGVLSKP